MLENNKNLTCEFAEELVSYLYDELSGTDKARFEKHLGGCSPCAEELSEFSMARSSILEWRTEEFLPLPTPIIEIPYEQKVIQFETKPVSSSWFAPIRAFFTLSPAWMTATTALAALVICVGLFLVMFSSLPGSDDVMVQTNDKNIKVSPSPTTDNKNLNSNTSGSKETEQNTDNSPEPPSRIAPNNSKDVTTAPVKASTVTKPQNVNVRKVVQPKPENKVNKIPSTQTKQKAPSLIEEEDEDDSLRLSDLLEGIGTK